MMTDSELETLVRATLANRATTVTDAPAAPTVLPPRPRRTWLPALAAAAAVAIAVAGVLVGIHLANGGRPAGPEPKPGPVPTTCPTALPDPWRTAFDNSAMDTRGRTTQVLSIAPDGSVLAVQDNGPVPGSGRFVVRLRPGQQPEVVLNVPDPDSTSVAIAQQYQHWLLVGYQANPRPAKGTIPGSSPLGLTKIVVFDLAAHTSRTLYVTNPRQTGPQSHVNAAVAFDGQVYWDLSFGRLGSPGVVRSYDLATGAMRTVYHGQVGYPEVTANGVDIQIAEQHRVVEPAQLPDPVAHAVTDDERWHLGTDNTAYAWLVSPRVLGWWAPGAAAPTYRRLPKAFADHNAVDPPLVAGRFVLTTNDRGTTTVTDMHGGGSARLPGTAGAVSRPDLYLARGGVLAGLGFTEGSGHYIDGYWADAAMTVLRIDTNALPPLTC